MSTTPETGTKQAEQTQVETSADEKPVLVARERAAESREGQDIHLTPTAAEKIKEIIRSDNYPDTMYLYVGVKGGGCSGLSYVLDLRDEATAPVKDTDEVFRSQDITIVTDLKSYMVGNLSGTTIDYQETLMGAGFTFNNPNAKSTCGCGSSYSA